LREGLRLIERRKREEQDKLEWLRSAVQAGIEGLDRGKGIEVGSEAELNRAIARLNAPAPKK